ncbi:hypothetical protein [Streptomyces sp. NBC_01233]|uniref:hypothetical protein n=1 Tax=Streptomyces sp. NBC_01233 TaxID=2903787 RepID=UPI002E100FED|nr:hypothetical protein OG332_36975 [Streptomyces sp. NBC_01233]
MGVLRLRLFDVNGGGAVEITARPAELERHLQDVVEGNMELLLGVRFLASEYSTGPVDSPPEGSSSTPKHGLAAACA